MNQQSWPEQPYPSAHIWSPSTIQEQIRGIEDLMTSSCWLLLSPRQKQNWHQQLNGLRCRLVFKYAYSGSSA